MADLITIQEYKDSLSITKMEDDPRLTILVAAVSQLVKTYCANSFVDFFSVDKVESFNVVWETDTIQLSESPVISVSLVEERTSYSTAYVAKTTTANEYYLDLATDSVLRTTGSAFINWAQGPGSVRITYRAGYTAIPADLQLSVIDLVTYYHKEQYKERRTLQGASISNKTTSSQNQNVGFPDHIKRVLDLYKQIHI